MSIFKSDVIEAENKLLRAKKKGKIFKVLTFGIIDNRLEIKKAQDLLDTELNYAETYNNLSERAKQLDDDLLRFFEIDGIRISKNTFADFKYFKSSGYPKDWENLRKIILTRDNYQCQEKSRDCEGPLQIHHRIPLSNGGSNSPSNLITLCLYHHSQKHDHMRRKYFGNFRC